MTTAIEPSADEIERVRTAIVEAWLRGPGWAPVARAAILAMDRRAEVGEPQVLIRAIFDMRETLVDCSKPHAERVNRALRRLDAVPFGRYASPPAPAVAVPAGWKLVPVEPTYEMSVALGCDWEGRPNGARPFPIRWKSMLAAAPEPPATRSEKTVGKPKFWKRKRASGVAYAVKQLHFSEKEHALAWVRGHHPAEIPAAEAGWSDLAPAFKDNIWADIYSPPATRSEADIRNEGIEADHDTIELDVGNYYGGLCLKREGGKDFWCVENYDGMHWKPCDPAVATAIRSLKGQTDE